jgi:DNA topoisomerase III
LNFQKTLKREIVKCQTLIIWTDCDREGENIGYEIIDLCRPMKVGLKVYRARFSEITYNSAARALSNLIQPDSLISAAVDVRQELDLRIGAAFTRFQTLRLQRLFGFDSKQVISYGSCQFPTLGFIVERYQQRENFIREVFWKITVEHQLETGQSCEFSWERHRLFEHQPCLMIYDMIMDEPLAKVMDIKSKSKSKWRPVALDTVVSVIVEMRLLT